MGEPHCRLFITEALVMAGYGERLKKRAQRLPGHLWVDADAVIGDRFKLERWFIYFGDLELETC